MSRRKKTFAEKHPDMDKVRVDFLNPQAAGCKEPPLVFFTQKTDKGKDQTLVFHLDIAIKTLKGILPRLREYKKMGNHAVTIIDDDFDRYTERL